MSQEVTLLATLHTLCSIFDDPYVLVGKWRLGLVSSWPEVTALIKGRQPGSVVTSRPHGTHLCCISGQFSPLKRFPEKAMHNMNIWTYTQIFWKLNSWLFRLPVCILCHFCPDFSTTSYQLLFPSFLFTTTLIKKLYVFLIGGWLFYNAVVASALHQLESVIIIYIHTYPLPLEPPYPHPTPLRYTQAPCAHRSCLCCPWAPCAHSSCLCYLWAPCVTHHLPLVISFTYDNVYLPLSQFVLPSPPLCPALWTLCPFSTSESLFRLSILWNRIVFPEPQAITMFFWKPWVKQTIYSLETTNCLAYFCGPAGTEHLTHAKKPILHVGTKPLLPQTCILEDDTHSPQTQKRNHCIFCVKPKLHSS